MITTGFVISMISLIATIVWEKVQKCDGGFFCHIFIL